MRWLLGLVLWPTAAGVLGASVWTLIHLMAQPRLAASFLAGFFGYIVLHLFYLRLSSSRIYVLSHEMTHAIAGWMSGAKILGMSIGSDRGHVDLSHSNMWVALAPYVVPLYAVMVVGAYRLWLWWSPPSPTSMHFIHEVFLFAVGSALAFHLVETAEALWGQHQPDLDYAGGIVFSLAVITFMNGVILILALKGLFPRTVSLRASFGLAWTLTTRWWSYIFSVLGPVRRTMASRIHSNG